MPDGLHIYLAQVIFILLWMMGLHVIADGFLQSREMGTKKSSEFKWLAYHIAIIFSVIALGLMPLVGVRDAIILSLFNAIPHAIIDSVVWRLYKVYVYFKFRNVTLESPELHTSGPAQWDQVSAMSKKDLIKFVATNNYKYWEDHNFYTTILFDQFLHMATIVVVVWLFFL